MIDEEKLRKSFGERVRSIRERNELTLLDIEVATGISEGALSKIENGKKNVNLPTVFKLAAGLNVEVTDLVSNLFKAVEGPI
ncbi:Helix-turn-helix [Chitinophaga jiangningensis]|uniref:Helix-turn-helix n=1 Tax=Chitinophaga jiangningensis TaxID=1419482 RepID=A0A1M7HDV4_9BACT|nr:helix-turn-helix transcriptional regulator [Chitinophaga jiangningensis]SHM26712.1 Helix-turn-helix [Chitinophaga jiangningensis]